jgi:flagellin
VLRINTNVAAINTQRQVRLADHGVSKALERLSSGLRVNRASDDAASLSISEALRAQVRGSQRAASNIQDGISLVNVADGALNEIHATLQRMRELAVQSANGTLTDADRAATHAEFTALQAEIGNIAGNTTFNGLALFTGQAGGYQLGQTFSTVQNTASNTPSFAMPAPSASAMNGLTVSYEELIAAGPPPVYGPSTALAPSDFSITQTPAGNVSTTPVYQYAVTVTNPLVGAGPFRVTAQINIDYPTNTSPLQVTFQVGANNGETDMAAIPPVNTNAMGIATASLTSLTNAQVAITATGNAIAYISRARGGIGATARSLEHTMNAVMIGRENMDAAFSRIRDNDMADGMTTLTRQQILTQSSLSMLAIANDSRTILGLFS